MAPSQDWGTPTRALAKPRPKPGIDQSPGGRPGPPTGAGELSQGSDPRADGRGEACSGGRGMTQRGRMGGGEGPRRGLWGGMWKPRQSQDTVKGSHVAGDRKQTPPRAPFTAKALRPWDHSTQAVLLSPAGLSGRKGQNSVCRSPSWPAPPLPGLSPRLLQERGHPRALSSLSRLFWALDAAALR